MDTLRGHDSTETDLEDRDFLGTEEEGDAAIDAPMDVGADERRMHVRAYNYWASLLGTRIFPSIEDLNPDELEDFSTNSVLLDFTGGIENPAISYLGTALRTECGIDGTITHINDVPARSLLSRLTDHYLQIIANSAPIGFEAEFVNQRGVEIMYRGILMPFSSDDDTIDFIYGVINWKEAASSSLATALAQEVSEALRTAPQPVSTVPVWADGPHRDSSELQPMAQEDDTLDLGAFAVVPDDGDDDMPLLAVADDAGLYDRLAAAREGAEQAHVAFGRSHQALYRAIGLTYDFALAAEREADDFAEMLEDAGIKVQARSPMTAVAKLIFGARYDKSRLAEIALILAHARAQDLGFGVAVGWLSSHAGGIKALVADIRASQRRERPARPDRLSTARQRLGEAKAIDTSVLETGAGDFAVLVARREADGSLAIVATLNDTKLSDQVLVRAAR